MVVSSRRTASSTLTSSTLWNRAASRGLTRLPHCQPKYCAAAYAADRPVSSAAPKVAAKNASTATASPIPPSGQHHRQRTWSRVSSEVPGGWKTTAAVAISDSARNPPSGKPTSTFEPGVGQIGGAPALLHPAGGEEEHLVRADGGGEQRHREEPVGAPALPGGAEVHGLVAERRPVGGQQRTARPRRPAGPARAARRPVSISVEAHPPQHQPDGERGDRHPQQVADAGGQLQGQRHPAQLGGQRQHRDEVGRDQVEQRHPRPEPLPDQVEHRPPLTAAIRPAISAYAQMPSTPTSSTQAWAMPNRAPAWLAATRSPMSTKPPMAESTPRVTARSLPHGGRDSRRSHRRDDIRVSRPFQAKSGRSARGGAVRRR